MDPLRGGFFFTKVWLGFYFVFAKVPLAPFCFGLRTLQMLQYLLVLERLKCCILHHLLVLEHFKCCELHQLLVLEHLKCCKSKHLLFLEH